MQDKPLQIEKVANGTDVVLRIHGPLLLGNFFPLQSEVRSDSSDLLIIDVAGTAHFHDFGRFLADLENQFPHIRVLNLSLELNQSPIAEEQETVSFKLDIVTLVKTNPS